ncbi:DENND6 protein [Phytophthora cactorum]|nr:DENND6 protein [Phytophthora cactorum]
MHAAAAADGSDPQDLASTYGLRALATVVFDIDSGQKLDALHPPTCGLSEAAKTSLAHLSLPHCNNQDEGDTQFIVRFRDGPDDRELLFGFVLFRQQKDESRTRGYFQKALVLVSTKPYVDLYDRVLRVIGPLFFKAGPQVLAAVYNNIKSCLIAPLQFQGDCRPYFTVYEADFDSLSHWPNALIFPFLEPPSAKVHPGKGAARAEHAEAEETGTICLRIQKNVELDDFENSHRPMLLRRCPRYVVPDVTVLHQLVSPPEVRITQTTSHEEEPYVTINNAVLRKHFRKLTKDFLHPFEQYFGIWKPSGRRSNLYMSAEDYMKPFTLPGLLSSIKPRKLPPQIKQAKWKALYTAFVKGPHFEPWFNYRRQRCIHDFANTLRALRDGVDADLLLSSPFGANLSQEQYVKLKKEMEVALALEKAQGDVDKQQVRTIKKHLKAVKEKLRFFKET